jgi:hypothetical protein
MTPKSLVRIEQLKEEVDQAEGAAKAEAQCIQLGDKMEAHFVPDDELDMNRLTIPKKRSSLKTPSCGVGISSRVRWVNTLCT